MKKRNYDELLKSGNAAQIEKLKENEHKSGFDKIELLYAINRIEEELEELKQAPDIHELRREAADIANFAHMIIYRADSIIAELSGIVK